MRRWVIQRRGFVAEGFAGGRVFQFCDGADISRVQLIDSGGCLPLPDFEMLKTFDGYAIWLEKQQSR